MAHADNPIAMWGFVLDLLLIVLLSNCRVNRRGEFMLTRFDLYSISEALSLIFGCLFIATVHGMLQQPKQKDENLRTLSGTSFLLLCTFGAIFLILKFYK